MTTRHHRPNLLSVAFLAFAGMLWVGDSAKACAELTAPKACCKASPAAACHCCGSSVPVSKTARSERTDLSVSSPMMRADASLSGSSCECREDRPAAPAPKPDPRNPEESRVDAGHDEVIAYLDRALGSFLPAIRLVTSNVSPPKFPIYLRTLHLLV